MQTDTSILKLDINLIIPNKYQPRKVFDNNSLDSLAESIKHYGIINPILVRKKDDKYEIIAGERRYRAAKQIGLTEVPVIIKNANEQQMAELALIENIQRQGLSPIEEAKSYEEIMRIGNQTQSSLAAKLGKSQSSIANKIRLLTLPIEIQNALANKQISERHARTLIIVEDKEKQLELLNKIIKEKLTVKETEQLVNAKEITEEEITQAINDIMKSLNISEKEKEEKEDDNMNNGNFFPNFDNNNAANNNASLNMMNMQSMNQAPLAPEPEMVMPTVENPGPAPQLVVPTTPIETPAMPTIQEQPMNSFEQFGPDPSVTPELNMNNNFNSTSNFMTPPNDMGVAPQTMTPAMDVPMMNEQPLFTQQFEVPVTPAEPQMMTPEASTMSTPIADVPLFNPNITIPPVEATMPIPTQEITPNEPQIIVPEQPIMSPSFEVPVTNNDPVIAPSQDKLTELQNLLTINGYNYKVYSNETDNCVIIELPKK